MAFYMKNKPSQTNQTYLKKIQVCWQKRITESNKIILIGINPNLEDRHIWEYLSSTKAEIGFVGNNSGFEKLKNLATNPPTKLEEKFEKAIPEINDFIFN